MASRSTRRTPAKKAPAKPEPTTVQTTMEQVAAKAQASYRAAQDNEANIGDRALRNLDG